MDLTSSARQLLDTAATLLDPGSSGPDARAEVTASDAAAIMATAERTGGPTTSRLIDRPNE
jgi:hypothetical protein